MAESVEKCFICEKEFGSLKYLKRHLKIHDNQKLFKCHLCEKSFAQRNFNLHLKRHNGEKSFKCDFCDKSFFQKNDLNKHLKIRVSLFCENAKTNENSENINAY